MILVPLVPQDHKVFKDQKVKTELMVLKVMPAKLDHKGHRVKLGHRVLKVIQVKLDHRVKPV